MTLPAPSGASAYFSVPEPNLDPSLFSGSGILLPQVSAYILGMLGEFFRREGIQHGPWLHAWLAGSGASYQWKASRGDSDLDVLLGISIVSFTSMNPGLGTWNRQQLAGILNEQMRKYLWPLTAAVPFGGSTYEITYYWNPQVSDDIRVIRPYAAWNLLTGNWDVPPDPDPPAASFPPEWETAAGNDASLVCSLYRDWSAALHDTLLLPAGDPARASAAAALQRVTAQMRGIWDVLHEGRRSAFTEGGNGWADWHNYRWQAAKRNGILGLLREVIREDDQRRAATETSLYGAPVDPAEIALRRAASSHTRWAQR
jgi:hypothetical protein